MGYIIFWIFMIILWNVVMGDHGPSVKEVLLEGDSFISRGVTQYKKVKNKIRR